jgi:hypothetical protein
MSERDAADKTTPQPTEGVARIAAERARQINEKGWTPEHDDTHTRGELALAAVCYASPRLVYVRHAMANGETYKDPWPWETGEDARPYHGNSVLSAGTDEQRIELLVKAGALIAAEIDRLERKRIRCSEPQR